MPLPFIAAAVVAVAAAGYGAKKTYDAKNDYDKAKSINDEAESLYDNAKNKLEKERLNTESALKSLGTLKFNISQDLIIPFVDSFKFISDLPKNVIVNGEQLQLPSKNVLNDMINHSIELKEIVRGGIQSLGAGGLAGLAAYGSVGAFASASTGTAISGLSGVAATNATLAWLGGGSIATGGLGIAGGTAVLGGIVAVPVLAIGGMMLASKAEAAKNDAYTNLEKSKIASKEMKLATVSTVAIKTKIVELINVLFKLIKNFKPMVQFINELTRKSTDFKTYSEKEITELYIAFQHYETINNLLNLTLLTKEGSITSNVNQAIEETTRILEINQQGNLNQGFVVKKNINEKKLLLEYKKLS